MHFLNLFFTEDSYLRALFGLDLRQRDTCKIVDATLVLKLIIIYILHCLFQEFLQYKPVSA